MSFGDCPVFRRAQRGLPAKANRSSRRLPIPFRAFAPSFPAAIVHRPDRLAPARRRRHTAALLSVCCSSALAVGGARAVKATKPQREAPKPESPETQLHNRRHPQRSGGCHTSTRSPLRRCYALSEPARSHKGTSRTRGRNPRRPPRPRPLRAEPSASHLEPERSGRPKPHATAPKPSSSLSGSVSPRKRS